MSEFVWWPAKGYGFLPPDKEFDYGKSYFENFKTISETTLGIKLNEARAELVTRYWEDDVVDVGVGSGQFLRTINGRCGVRSSGYDVAKPAVEWLKAEDLWFDLSAHSTSVATFWDSIEHMVSPEALLVNVRLYAIVSIPVFESAEHAYHSHHFKPDEHLWYFTEDGFVGWMAKQGFSLVERSRMEERFTRKDIGTYVFTRE